MNDNWLEAFLQAVVTQDKELLRSFFQEDAQILWPNTKERFDVEGYLRANCEYPDEWIGNIKDTYSTKDHIIMVSRIQRKDRELSFHVVSILSFDQDKIKRMEEFWSQDDEVPSWRKELQISSNLE